jgi:aminoglycoside phosphotransferase (APT) family kinase protein
MIRVTEGINAAPVTAWLADHVEGVHPPFTFELISGGRSNLTFAVTDAAGRRLVLRRPPMSHVLPTAHDMGREYRIISALRPTPVPVATALGYCDDEAVNERPFYVMDFVDGFILRGAADGEAALDKRTRRVAGEDLVDVLAAIHHVDVDAVGLGNLARRDGYIERQLRRWHGQFQQSQQQAREIGVYRPVPLVDEVHRLLAERVPPQHGTAIVHGDYRIDNTVISAEGRIQAVLDWELCTLGDALADVGTLLAYWSDHAVAEMAGPPPDAKQAAPEFGATQPGATQPGATQPGATQPGATQPGATGQLAATALPGFPSRAEVADRYAARSGRDLTQLGFYVAFAYWKLACILEGVFVRYAAHAMSDDRSAADALAPGVEDRARRALEALQGSPADKV